MLTFSSRTIHILASLFLLRKDVEARIEADPTFFSQKIASDRKVDQSPISQVEKLCTTWLIEQEQEAVLFNQ
jgi:hypothetical protein